MNLYALFFGLALFGFCSCDNDDSVTPDPQARQAFESKYPNATQVEWEEKQLPDSRIHRQSTRRESLVRCYRPMVYDRNRVDPHQPTA